MLACSTGEIVSPGSAPAGTRLSLQVGKGVSSTGAGPWAAEALGLAAHEGLGSLRRWQQLTDPLNACARLIHRPDGQSLAARQSAYQMTNAFPRLLCQIGSALAVRLGLGLGFSDATCTQGDRWRSPLQAKP